MHRAAGLLLSCSACGRIAFDPLPDSPIALPDATRGCQGGTRIVIDELASGLASPLTVDVIGTTEVRESDLAGVLGGSRTARLSMTAGSGSLSARIDSGSLMCSSGALSDGAIELVYDGDVFDLSDCGTAAVTTAFSDLGLDITLALTDAASQSAQLSRPGAATMTPTDVTLSLSDPAFSLLDRTRITQISVRFDGPSGADFSIAASRAE